MSTDEGPCRVCGAEARLVVVQDEVAAGEPETEAYQARVCTNPSCETNNPDKPLFSIP